MKLLSCSLLVSGLFGAGLVGGATAQTATTINVSLTSYAFTPSTLSLNAGTPYHFHLTNDGSKGHSFHAPEFFAASAIAPADQSKIEKEGEVEVEGGQAVDFTLTPSRPGTYALDCSHFMHHLLGMHGKIVVQ
jgi:plastocyanin